MKLKALALALAVAASAPAMAATFNLGTINSPSLTYFENTFSRNQSFTDTYNFTLGNSALAFGGVLELDLNPFRGINLTSVSLQGASLSSTITDTSPLLFSFGDLLAGSYSLVVSGQVVSGPWFGAGSTTYSGLLGTLRTNVAAPVPEPETFGMLALGLAAIGFVARRRKQK